MSILPTGETVISPKFNPVVPSPDPSGLIKELPPLYDLDLTNSDTTENLISRVRQGVDYSSTSYYLEVIFSKQIISSSEPYSDVSVSLLPLDSSSRESLVPVTLSLKSSDSSNTSIQVVPQNAVTDSSGYAHFRVYYEKYKLEGREQNLELYASVIGSDIKSEGFLVKLVGKPFRLGQVSLTKINDLPSIYLQDAGFKALSDTFELVTALEKINQDQNNPVLAGSRGSSGYAGRGKIHPETFSTTIDGISNSIRSIQGFTRQAIELSKRWGKQVLHDTHANPDGEKNSELRGAVKATVGSSVTSCYLDYASLVAKAGEFSASVAQAFLPDYAEGHDFKKTNGVEQKVCDQFRVYTSSGTYINSPAIHLYSQQTLNYSRFHHALNDLNQITCQHYWVRAADQHTRMAKCDVALIDQTQHIHAANSNQYIGSRFLYADEERVQIGNSEGTLIHENTGTRFRYGFSEKSARYGFLRYAPDGGYSIKTKYDIQFVSSQGRIYGKADVFDFPFQNTFSLFSATGKFRVTSNSIHLRSLTNLFIDAPNIAVNSNLSDTLNATSLISINIPDIPQIVPARLESPPPIPTHPVQPAVQKAETSGVMPTPNNPVEGPNFGTLTTPSIPLNLQLED